MVVRNGFWKKVRHSVILPVMDRIETFLRDYVVESKIISSRYLNRYLVLLIDLCLVALSMFFIYFALYSLDLKKYSLDAYGLIFGLHMLFYGLGFVIFSTYSGVVRHSTFYDLIKLFFATSLSFFSLWIVNRLTVTEGGEALMLDQLLLINYMSILISLVFFRIVVKYFYDRIRGYKRAGYQKQVLIVGTSHQSVSLAQGLLVDPQSSFVPVGFLSSYGEGLLKKILNLPIYPPQTESLIELRKKGLTGVVIILERFTVDELNLIADLCFEADLEIFKYGLLTDDGDELKGEKASQQISRFNIEDLLGREPIQLNNLENHVKYGGRTVMVTGAAGSIGSEIARQVLNFNPKTLVLLDQSETPLFDLKMELGKLDTDTELVYLIEDVRRLQDMDRVFDTWRPEIVFHAAAYKHVPMMEDQPEQAVTNNVGGTMHVADLSVKYKVDTFLLVSTDKAVNPANVMGATKRVAELYVQELSRRNGNGKTNTRFVITRFGNVLGSNGSVIPIFSRQIEEGGPVTITHSDIVRYFMTIPEACQLVLEACTMAEDGQIVVFDMGKPVRIRELAEKMIRLAGLRVGEDIKIEVVGLRPGEKMYEELVHDDNELRPSHHPKIMILKDGYYESDIHMFERIQRLSSEVAGMEPRDIVSELKIIVPEYLSENSPYVSLDTVR